MNESWLKLTAAFTAGFVGTAWIVRLLSFLPVPAYIRYVLWIVIPLPVMGIALVMLFFGPEAAQSAFTEQSPRQELLKMFLVGGLATLGSLGVWHVWRFFTREPGEDDADDE